MTLNPQNFGAAHLVISGVVVWVVGFWFLRMYEGPDTAGRVGFVLLVLVLILQSGSLHRQECWLLLYSATLGAALLIATIASSDPMYSAPRALTSCLLFGTSGIVAYRFVNVTERYADEVLPSISAALSAFLLVLLSGYLFGFGGFRSGGMGGFRLAAGINPNTAGFLAFTTVVWSLLSAFSKGYWRTYDRILFLLAITVAALSFSRSAWLALSVLFAFLTWVKLLRILVMGRFRTSLLVLWLAISVAGIVLTFIILLFNAFLLEPTYLRHPIAQYLETRLSVNGDDNLSSRARAWGILLAEFRSNPLFGGVGWYNSTRLLDQHPDVAASPHSLHVRLLSEVGLVGYISIIALPLLAILVAVKRTLNTVARNSKNPREHQFWGVVAGSLVAYFSAREFFENTYMVSYLNFATMFAIVLIVISLRGFALHHATPKPLVGR
ncbi:hypothetical protein REJC140_03415 [Pseudorhizobium endolithicum]|uniref:O-antigen ligase-related domain-containing protein n=1 Tax=Pseudorhizobium endolithicum TaxID=1191678 RepID=A0ABN7JL56_9HYPH|nr:hypothetical protein REJC140_03415 [Pseudorhizobium endolithicum]